MKRFVSTILALVLLLSLAACTEGGLSLDPNDKASSPNTSDSKDSDDKSDDDKSGGKEDDYILPDEDGMALGYEGDTLRTAFFDMTITDPCTCDEFDGLTPEEGYKFLAVTLTLYNYTNYSVPMYDTDFEVIWDLDDDDAWAWPECDEMMTAGGKTEYHVRSDKQIPVEFDLGIHKTETGILLFQVPEDATDFFIDFYEVFDDGSDEGEYGDAFYVRFSA